MSTKAVPQPAEPVMLPVATENPAEHNNAPNIDREQEYIHKKGKNMFNFLKRAKAGEVKPEVPSNENVESILAGGATGIEKFQNSERGSTLPAQHQKVLSDVKDILEQQNTLVKERNDQEQVQTFAKTSVTVVKDVSSNPVVKDVVNKWKGQITESMKNKNWKDMAKMGEDIISTLREIEAFLEFTVEIGKIAKILSSKDGEKRDENLQAMLTEMTRALKVLSNNSLWKQAVSIQEPVSQEQKEDLHTLRKAFKKEQLNQLSEAAEALLQSIVGDAVSVRPFIEATIQAIHYILGNNNFIQCVRETQTIFMCIAGTPALADDPQTKLEMKLVCDKLDLATSTLLNNQDVIRAREEGDRLVRKMKEDPANKALLANIRKLREDSSNPLDILAGLRSFIVPFVLDHLNNVPVPNSEFTVNVLGSTKIEISDMKVALREFLPKNLHIKVLYEFEGDAQNLSVHQQQLVVAIDIKNLQLNMKNFSWNYTRGKTTDQGKASLSTAGKGISLSLVLVILPNEAPMITVKKAKAKIDKFTMEYHESKRDRFYSFLTSMGSRSIRNNVETVIVNKMRAMGPTLEIKLQELMNQVNKAPKFGPPNRPEAQPPQPEAEAQPPLPTEDAAGASSSAPVQSPSSSTENGATNEVAPPTIHEVKVEPLVIEQAHVGIPQQ